METRVRGPVEGRAVRVVVRRVHGGSGRRGRGAARSGSRAGGGDGGGGRSGGSPSCWPAVCRRALSGVRWRRRGEGGEGEGEGEGSSRRAATAIAIASEDGHSRGTAVRVATRVPSRRRRCRRRGVWVFCSSRCVSRMWFGFVVWDARCGMWRNECPSLSGLGPLACL